MAYEFNIAEAINVIRDLVGPDRRRARELGLEGMESQNKLTGAQTRQTDATTKKLVKRPRCVYVHRIHDEVSFTGLGL